jgi:heme/copper-type cytochrome/quinol oxidase subunit 2
MRAVTSLFTARAWTVVGLVVVLTVGRGLAAQDAAPSRKDIAISVRDFRFTPARVEVRVDDLVRVTVQSEDIAYGFTIDEYRVSKRVPAGGSVMFEFHADRAGTFPFYSSLTSDARHTKARGELVVRGR